MQGSMIPGLYGLSNWQVSSSCGTFTGSSTSYADITNLSVPITTNGRPVIISLSPDNSGLDTDWTPVAAGTNFKLIRTASAVDTTIWESLVLISKAYLPRLVVFDDYVNTVPGAAYTYRMQYKVASGTLTFTRWRLFAWEIGT